MKNKEKRAEEFAKELAHLYFEKRDIEKLLSYMSDDITWIGTGENEIFFNKAQSIEYFKQESTVYDGTFHISDERYQAFVIDQNNTYVISTMTVSTPELSSLYFENKMRFSLLFDTHQEPWVLKHYHHSIPDFTLNECNFLNVEMAKETYHRVHQRKIKMQFTDELTGLYNMDGFMDQARKMLKIHFYQKHAILSLTIPCFERLERLFGYTFAQQFIQSISKELKKSCHNFEICARQDKVNFMLFYIYDGTNDLNLRIWKLIETVQKHADKAYSVNVHIGVYISDPQKKEDVFNMIDKADIALHTIENKNKSQYVIYHEQMVDHQREILTVLECAKEAMNKHLYTIELKTYHQQDILLNEVHVSLGSSNEENYLNIYEDYGLIEDYDFYILKKVCQLLKEKIAVGQDVAPVLIKQSPLHLEDEHYFERFNFIVNMYNIPHQKVMIMLDHKAFVRYEDAFLSFAQFCHEEGYKIVIECSGVVSLETQYLLLVDGLKINAHYFKETEQSLMMLDKISERLQQFDVLCIVEHMTLKQKKFFATLQCYTALNDDSVEEVSL